MELFSFEAAAVESPKIQAERVQPSENSFRRLITFSKLVTYTKHCCSLLKLSYETLIYNVICDFTTRVCGSIYE